MRARDVPDLRDQLIARWQPGQPFALTASMHSLAATRDPFEAATIAKWNAGTLRDGELWYVSAEMSSLLQLAAAELPPAVLTPELPYCDQAFVVFEQPLEGLDARTGEPGHDELVRRHRDIEERKRNAGIGTVLVDALCFGWSSLQRGPTMSITSYRNWLAPDFPDGLWLPLGHSSWELGRDHSYRISEAISDEMAASHAEDRAWLLTLWSFARQPRLVEHELHEPDRADRRRAARKGRTAPSVRLVSLRREIAFQGQPERIVGEGGRAYYRCRWPVTGHWRQQPYGPSRSLRRPTYIEPYIKGPAGAPLKKTEVVRVLKGD